MLFSTPPLTDDDRAILAAIDTHREAMRYNLSAPHRWVGTLARQQRARDTVGSNSIEGIHVSREQALAIRADSADLVEVDEDWLAVRGYSDAMTYARIMADEGRDLSLPDLLALHFMTTAHDLKKRPGRLRRTDIYVQQEGSGRTVYTGPAPEEVDGLLDELLSSLASNSPDEHPLVSAAMAHLNLVMIHPFSDGNGRMSRILQSWRLYWDRLAEAAFVSVEEYLGRNTEAYYAVLAEVGAGRWAPERDASPWLEFMLTAHYRQAMTIRRRIDVMEQVARRVDELIDTLALPERAAAPLEFVLTDWRLTNALYRDAAGVTRPTASRDLNLLTKAGVLVREGDKRGAAYSPSAELQQWVELTRRSARQRFDVAADPYRSLRRGRKL